MNLLEIKVKFFETGLCEYRSILTADNAEPLKHDLRLNVLSNVASNLNIPIFQEIRNE